MVLFKYDDFLVKDAETGGYTMPQEQVVRDEVERNRWKGMGGNILTDWRLYLMLVPMLAVYILWKYLPMTNLLDAFKYSTDSSANATKYWMGFYYFQQLLYADANISMQFWNAFRNTFVTAFYGLLFGFPIPILLAIFFNEVRSNVMRSILQVCVYLPKFLSTVVVTTLAVSLFSGTSTSESGQAGILTKLLTSMMSDENKVSDLLNYGVVQSAGYYRGVYIFTDLWEHAGYDSIVFFAAVIAISPTSYEAAQIDGAGKMSQMRYVVLPSILSTIVIMLIMKIGSLLSVGYEKIYLLETDKTYEVADVVSTWANRQDAANQCYAIAGEMLNNIIGMILVIGANTISKRASDVSLY
ncbi:MAG: ABC transporter permease subunit [Bacteroidales bacterium]|nr:ABC transporter permease subunit [Bacteroidales bacterium]